MAFLLLVQNVLNYQISVVLDGCEEAQFWIFFHTFKYETLFDGVHSHSTVVDSQRKKYERGFQFAILTVFMLLI